MHSHAQAFTRHERTNLVGISDIDTEKLEAAQKLWQTSAATDAVALCRELKPEIVSICTPDKTHFELSKRILSESPPRILFVEKPLTLISGEAEELLKLAKTVDCRIAVNYSRRFSPAVRKLKQEIIDGIHGKPVLARIIYGKGLFHNGSHALDLLRFWFGEPLEFEGKPETGGLDGDQNYSVDLRFENDCRARLDTFDERIATVFELDCLTERTRWRFWLGGNLWEFSAVAPSPMYAGYFNFIPTGREQTDVLFVNPLAELLVLRCRKYR